MTVYEAVDYSRLPEHMQHATREYVDQGRLPGGFLYEVLCNRLVSAFGHADATNFARMADWVGWLFNEAPQGCWGSPEKVAVWCERVRK